MSDPTREQVNQMTGRVVLEFGASWCGHCQAVRPAVSDLVAKHPEVRHLRIEDGPGRPLGRSFQVKLWPTFVFLTDGVVTHRLVRPSETALTRAFAEESLP